MTFSDVCGQDHITSILRYEVENGKTSHAYLFCGSRGTGKTTCAKILARAVNCEHPENGDPCGKCPSCLSAASGACIDIIEMDAASNNGVEDIRQIRDEVEYLPAELKYKVYIIDEVHMLSPSAFNALLKTLEEPPPHVIFILATTELQKIPATILSRCQRFDFRRIGSDVIASRLEYIAKNENITLDHEAAFMLAHLAQGGMRDAISLLELCSGENRPVTTELVEEVAGTGGRDSVIKLLNAVCDRDYDTIFAEIGKTFMSSRDIAVFWQDIISFYRDMLVAKTTKNAKDYLDLTEKQYAELVSVAGRFSAETLVCHAKLLDDSLDAMRRAASKRLVAEMTLVRMCDERFQSTNEALMSRIAALEDRINSGAFAPKATVQTQPAQPMRPPVSEPDDEPPVYTATDPLPGRTEPVKPTPPAQPEQAPEALSEPPVKKEYRQLPYWAELVEKCNARDQLLGSMMRNSAKGFTVNTDNFIHIRATNPVAQQMITNLFPTLLELLNTFEDGKLDRMSVKLEYSPEKKTDSDDLKELVENAGKEQ